MSKLAASPIVAVIWSGALACASYDMPADPTATVLTAVTPAGGAQGIGADVRMAAQFSGPIARVSAPQVALHRDHAAGSVVPGVAEVSEDARTIVFTPGAALQPRTRYALHIGGGIVDANGKRVDLRAGRSMGGEWVSWVMATGGTRARHGDQTMGGSRWQAANGTYGLLITFTTR